MFHDRLTTHLSFIPKTDALTQYSAYNSLRELQATSKAGSSSPPPSILLHSRDVLFDRGMLCFFVCVCSHVAWVQTLSHVRDFLRPTAVNKGGLELVVSVTLC